MLARLILAVDRRLTQAVWLLAATLLGLLACIGLYQVATRFVWSQPSPWSEELIGRLFVWCVMLGTVAAFRQGALVSVDLMLRLSGGAWRRFVRAEWLAPRWGVPVTRASDGPEAVVPWLCISFEGWFSGSIPRA